MGSIEPPSTMAELCVKANVLPGDSLVRCLLKGLSSFWAELVLLIYGFQVDLVSKLIGDWSTILFSMAFADSCFSNSLFVFRPMKPVLWPATRIQHSSSILSKFVTGSP